MYLCMYHKHKIMDIADSIFIAGNVYFHSNEVTYIQYI